MRGVNRAWERIKNDEIPYGRVGQMQLSAQPMLARSTGDVWCTGAVFRVVSPVLSAIQIPDWTMQVLAEQMVVKIPMPPMQLCTIQRQYVGEPISFGLHVYKRDNHFLHWYTTVLESIAVILRVVIEVVGVTKEVRAGAEGVGAA